MSVLERLKKNSTIKETDILEDSEFFQPKDYVTTSIPMLNVALSGSLTGGFASGLGLICGPSKHFKTLFCLLLAQAYLKKYPDGVMLFYDSEFGSPQAYFESLGIDTNRVIHTPITNIEELKHDLMNQLAGIEKKDRVIVVIDSVGNLASKKEVDDALEGKSVADMTRAKQLKSLFRMVTPILTIKDIPMMVVNHVYQTLEMFSTAKVSGGCLVEGTKIKMADGSLKNIEDILPGNKVITLDGPKEVSHIWNPNTLLNGTPECLKITFVDGYEVICSEDHPFLVNGNYIEAKNLKINEHEVTSI